MSDKLGHQAPKKWRYNRYFNYINIHGDLHYCHSHNFVYNEVEEERKLYNAKPCYHTDGRYFDSQYNYFKECYLYHTRREWNQDISLKSCIRKTLQCRNIPVGTIVEFQHDWYIQRKSGEIIPMEYKFKVRKENCFNPKYKINLAKFSRNFDNCEKSQQLTDTLRANGFLVDVSKGNPDFIMDMIATATKYSTGKRGEDREAGGQIAVAYGHGMMIGFSSGDNSFRGYSNGRKSVLYDYFGEFNKWSQCYEIDKDIPADEIINILLKTKKSI